MVKESEAATNGKIQQNGQVHQPLVTHACTASGSSDNNADFLCPAPPFPPPLNTLASSHEHALANSLFVVVIGG